MKKDNMIISLLVLVLIVSVVGVYSNFFMKPANIPITGLATTTNATSQVQVEYYLSISASSELSDGINFGTVTTLPSSNINATDNYNATNMTTLDIAVSQDSNTAVDFCIMADGNLNTTGGAEILLANETWDDNTTNSLYWPALNQSASLTTSYVKGSTSVPIGGKNYYRFWLNVTAGVEAGLYNNTIYFKGVTAGNPC